MTGASLAKCQSLLHYIFLSFVGVCVSVCVGAHSFSPTGCLSACGGDRLKEEGMHTGET